MTEGKEFIDKFVPINTNNSLPFPEIGDVINDGENNLVVCAIEKIDNKDYILFCDEKTTNVAVYAIESTAEGFKYNLIHDNTIFGKVIVNIVKRHDLEGEK